MCREFQCAWLSGVLPEWMRPNECHALITIRSWGEKKDKSYIKIQELGKSLDPAIFEWVKSWALQHNCPINFQVNGVWDCFGPQEFLDWVANFSSSGKRRSHDTFDAGNKE
jgi:hypothetical protein